MSKLIRVSVSLSPDLLEEFDRSRVGQTSTSRSDAVRRLMQDSLHSEARSREDRDVVATLTLNYSRRCADLARRLTEMQHMGLELVVSTTRVHLESDLCLEVLILKGPAAARSDLACRLCSVKGVMHGELVVATADGASRVPLTARASRQ